MVAEYSQVFLLESDSNRAFLFRLFHELELPNLMIPKTDHSLKKFYCDSDMNPTKADIAQIEDRSVKFKPPATPIGLRPKRLGPW